MSSPFLDIRQSTFSLSCRMVLSAMLQYVVHTLACVRVCVFAMICGLILGTLTCTHTHNLSLSLDLPLSLSLSTSFSLSLSPPPSLSTSLSTSTSLSLSPSLSLDLPCHAISWNTR